MARPAWRRSKERIRRPLRILRCSLLQDAFVSAVFRFVVRGFPFTHLGDLVDAEGLGNSLLDEGGGSHGVAGVVFAGVRRRRRTRVGCWRRNTRN